MKIGIFTALFGDKTLDETLDIVVNEGIEAVEFGGGAYPGAAHIEVEKLLESQAERDALMNQCAVIEAGVVCSKQVVNPTPSALRVP